MYTRDKALHFATVERGWRRQDEYGYGLEYTPDEYDDTSDHEPVADPIGDPIEDLFERAWREGCLPRNSPAARAWKERSWQAKSR
ncbi:hypothetical protein ACFV84_13775 [Kitasatospora sp. NPDC059811]|uniref:hypothetical protein n=1 Tax=Streptomycetaceae TaxID=2062 RepID=UPI000B09AB6B|nr:hypothetical protein [Streptomyces sp. MJM8645]